MLAPLFLAFQGRPARTNKKIYVCLFLKFRVEKMKNEKCPLAKRKVVLTNKHAFFVKGYYSTYRHFVPYGMYVCMIYRFFLPLLVAAVKMYTLPFECKSAADLYSGGK